MEKRVNNPYIEELIDKLNNTEIWLGTDRKYQEYSLGIQKLVEVFTRHKENGSQVFFIGNGGFNST